MSVGLLLLCLAYAAVAVAFYIVARSAQPPLARDAAFATALIWPTVILYGIITALAGRRP